MTDEPSRSIWEPLRLWLAAIGIPVVLAVAGFWQFYLKEVWWPAAAINLSTEVTIKEAGFSTKLERNLEAIEITITARNPSSSTIYICNNYWGAWGITISPSKQEGVHWIEDMTKEINSGSPVIFGEHYMINELILVAGGKALKDIVLRPNEKVSTTFVVYIPKNRYDSLEVLAVVPATYRESPLEFNKPALELNYEWDAVGSSYRLASAARVMPNGTQKEISLNAKGNLPESDRRYFQFQVASSSKALSLWQSDKPVLGITETRRTGHEQNIMLGKLSKVLSLLSSNHAGEREAAARMAEEIRKKIGKSWEEIIEPE